VKNTAFKFLVFDLDGTLIDSSQDITASINVALISGGFPARTRDEIMSFVGGGVVSLIQSALGNAHTDETFKKVLSRFRAHYQEHLLDQTVLYPSVKELLEAWPNTKKAVLTNKPQYFSMKILEGLGIAKYFNRVIGGDSDFPRKPNPSGLIHLMETLRCQPSETLMIGDSVVDIITGQQAETKTCFVTYGYGVNGNDPKTVGLDADFVIDQFDALEEIVGVG